MKNLPLVLLAAIAFSSCQQQQVPRPLIQEEVPIYSTKEKTITYRKKKKWRKKKELVTEVSMVSVSGPAAPEWDVFDRADAVMLYNEMPLKDKEVLFETIARVYTYLPKDNTLSSAAINTGIWKEVTDKGIRLSFGENPADWHPYLMYVHPVVVSEMTTFFLNAKEGSITDKELDSWQKAFCNLINARPDSMTMAMLINRKNELAKAGVLISETKDGFLASPSRVDWDQYRAAQPNEQQTPAQAPEQNL